MRGVEEEIDLVLSSGRVAGVAITNNNTIQIRGAAQLSTGNDPLIIVDGIVTTQADLSMVDLANIEVLKAKQPLRFMDRGQ